jgi:hypothetical protein
MFPKYSFISFLSMFEGMFDCSSWSKPTKITSTAVLSERYLNSLDDAPPTYPPKPMPIPSPKSGMLHEAFKSADNLSEEVLRMFLILLIIVM